MRLLPILLLLASCAAPPGAKLLRLHVEQAGQVLLIITFDASDRASVQEIWDEASKPFSSEEPNGPIAATVDDPLRASIKGPVRLTIIHVDRIESSATLDEVTLVRDTEAPDSWYLPPEEVERAKAVSK